MTPFSEKDKFQNPLDFWILRDGGISLYSTLEFLTDDVQWLAKEQYQVYSFDCRRWVSKDAMYADWQSVLSLDHSCQNLDALEDSLTDLAVPDAGGTVLVLHHFDAYSKGSGTQLMHSGRTEAEVVLDILAHTSRYFLLFAKRFLALVQTDDPRTSYERLGGLSAQWNRREWLNKNRGL